jgi:hypothetical protein
MLQFFYNNTTNLKPSAFVGNVVFSFYLSFSSKVKMAIAWAWFRRCLTGLRWLLICAGIPRCAALAQLVEHRIRNAGVGCSSHPGGTISFKDLAEFG